MAKESKILKEWNRVKFWSCERFVPDVEHKNCLIKIWGKNIKIKFLKDSRIVWYEIYGIIIFEMQQNLII